MDWISFQARFGGVPRKIMVPVSHVLAIYARERMARGCPSLLDASQNNLPMATVQGLMKSPKPVDLPLDDCEIG